MDIKDITANEGFAKLLSEKRWCFYVDASSKTDQGFVPSVVIEGMPGHYPMEGKDKLAAPWYWGHTLPEAEAVCKKANVKRGLTDDDVDDIITSSMFTRAQVH